MTTPHHDPNQTDREFLHAINVHYGMMAALVEQDHIKDKDGHRTTLRAVLTIEIEAARQAIEARLKGATT